MSSTRATATSNGGRVLHEAMAFFVTRPKTSARFSEVATRALSDARGDGFTVLKDCEVKLASRGDSKLPMRLRRIHVQRDALKDGKPQTIVVITNDMTRSAIEIAALYKARWAIELLFRWIKQHLEIRKFLGENENAVRLQLIAAMIAFVLLRIAAHSKDVELPPLRFSNSSAGSSSRGDQSNASIDPRPNTRRRAAALDALDLAAEAEGNVLHRAAQDGGLLPVHEGTISSIISTTSTWSRGRRRGPRTPRRSRRRR